MKRLEPWRLIDRQTLFAVPGRVSVKRDVVELPDGRRIEDFYRVELSSFVVVIAETEDGMLLAERSYKHGPATIGLSLPSGHIERDEPPLEAARRELLEETGHSARSWSEAGRFVTAGNQWGGEAHFFFAGGAVRVAEPCSGDLEETELVLLSRDEARAALDTGQVAILPSAMGIALWLGR
jgi:ADP-ribose pyrophosphatase